MRVAATGARHDPMLVKRVSSIGGELCVTRTGLAPKTRQFVVLNGFSPDHNLGVYHNDVEAVVRALTERYFFCSDGHGGFRDPIRVGKNAFKHPGLTSFRKCVSSHMPRLPVLTPREVVSLYTGSKRRLYEAAEQSLTVTPLQDSDAFLSSFVKFEKQDVSKAPRIINPRSPRYNLCLARYLKHAEKHFFTAINKAFGARTPATVIKGFNADRSAEILRAKWDRFRRPVAVSLDAEKFDMHCGVRALGYEHGFYKLLYPRDAILRRLLRLQLHNRGCARLRDGKVRFAIRGTRSSGDINTSLGNCILMCALMYAYAQSVGLDMELANNGDDCEVFLEQEDLKKLDHLPEWFRVRGFSMQVEPPAYEFEQLDFCQTRPVLTDGAWRMVRNLRTCLAKDAMCLTAVPNQKCYQRWLYAVGECGAVLCSGVPVLHEYYKMLMRHGVPCSDGFRAEVFRNRSQLQLARGVRPAELTAAARVSFYYAFGVTPDLQLELERALSRHEIQQLGSQVIQRDALHLLPGCNIVAHL